MMWLNVLTTIVLAVFLYLRFFKSLQFWKKKGIPHVKPWPFVGSMAPVTFRTRPLAHLLQDMYKEFTGQRYFGFHQFTMPTLMICDPELIKQICIKEFDTFQDHVEFLPKSSDPFWNRNLFSMSGNEWREMRTVLSPAFTSSKMRVMFCLMRECAQEFVKHFQEQSGIITLEMKDTFTRFTNDVIASTAFGIKCDSLKDKDNEFYRLGKNAFNFDGLRSLKFFSYAISPTLAKIFRIRFFDDYTKEFFLKVVKDTIKHREQTGMVRPDMINLLQLAQKGRLQYEEENDIADSGFAVVQESNVGKIRNNKKPEITDEDIAAQAFIFFFGGFDTVSQLMSHVAYELAVHSEIQRKLIEEVDKTIKECGDGEITYETLLGMKYLDMVVSETLRLWSPAVFINRKTVKPFIIEAKYPTEKPLELETGTSCLIPVYAIHRDSKYYPNPDKFIPERFSEENKKNISTFTYFPFGMGPRSCIASRFALLESKIVMFYLLSQFEILTTEKTQIPFELSKKNINIVNEVGYWFELKPRKKFV